MFKDVAYTGTSNRLCEQGYKVVGVELAEAAAKLFFTKYKLEHKVATADNGLTVYEVTVFYVPVCIW